VRFRGENGASRGMKQTLKIAGLTNETETGRMQAWLSEASSLY
jgi:hypothetical protein